MRSQRLLVLGLIAIVAVPAVGIADTSLPEFPAPIDPQSWELPDDMTWDDYVPIPGVDWNDPRQQPPRKLRAALILADFVDRGFIVSGPLGSDLAGNPIEAGSIRRRDVGEFYTRFIVTEPSSLNRGHTINEYWLENSYGLVGIDADAFGPYRLKGKEHEYGLNDFNFSGCPDGDDCTRDFDQELLQASLLDVTAGIALNGGRDYDFRFLLHAGYDESSVAGVFGRQRFLEPDDVPDRFGPPDKDLPNWVGTRNDQWTSWWAGKTIWSHALPGALSTQGESDGQSTYAHELSHIFGILDNYNDPFDGSRSYSGPWDMMSRGTFNGPGGPNNRWQVPPTMGGSMGSHHMLRNKIRLGFIKPNEVLALDSAVLAATGPVVANIWARSVPLAPVTDRVGLHGITIAVGPRAPIGNIDALTIEVVDRMGYDSFTPDHGVLLAETRAADAAPFIWVIDAHPEDIGRTDYLAPDGTPVPIGYGDYRQLSDALFHAGTGPGVVSESVHETAGVHLYVLGVARDAEGALSYRVGVRSTLGIPSGVRAVEVGSADGARAAPGRVAVTWFPVTNLGSGLDLVRVGVEVDAGWETMVRAPVLDIGPGETVQVPVYVKIPPEATGQATLTLTATSETDPRARATVSTSIAAG